MKCSKILLSFVVVIIVLSMSFNPVSALDEEPFEGTGVDLTAPLPLTPVNNQFVYTKTPKFLFTAHPEATSYRIRVYNGFSPSTPLYTYPGSGDCTETLCWLQPSYTLKTFQYDNFTGGYYGWEVEAYINYSWQNTSPPAYFYVLSKGFTSTFDLNTKKWTSLLGDWTRTSKGFYKTDGSAGYYASAMQNEYFEGNYVYEVRLKRKVETEPNALVINGSPDTMLANGTWAYSDVLEYSNSGTWRFLRFAGGTPEQLATGASPYITPFGWNTWTIWTNYPDIYVWVNEVFVVKVTDTNPFVGYVGIGMYKSGTESSPLLVDYAKLYYSSIRPMEVPEGTNAGIE